MSAVLTPSFPVAAPAPIPISVPTVPPPPLAAAQSPPQPFRWTVKQYRELYKTGWFNDKKTMLLNGVLYVVVMPAPPHDTALGLTDAWLRTVFTAGYHVRNRMGFDIGEDTDPGPDLAVVTGSIRDYSTATPHKPYSSSRSPIRRSSSTSRPKRRSTPRPGCRTTG